MPPEPIPPQLKPLHQKIKALQTENQQLRTKLDSFQSISDEFDRLREKEIVERITEKARVKLFSFLKILGFAAIPGFFGIYSAVLNRALTIVESKIQEQATLENITNRVTEDVSEKLTSDLKSDEEFSEKLATAASSKILEDQALIGRLETAANLSISNYISSASQVEQGDANVSFAEAVEQIAEGERYFVIVASGNHKDSEEKQMLNDMAQEMLSDGASVKICEPKAENRRAVLLLLNQEQLESNRTTATTLLKMAKEYESTAYLLSTTPDDRVFFDISNCRTPVSVVETPSS